MSFNYIPTKEAAKILGEAERYVQMLCKEENNGQGVWLVPQKVICEQLTEKTIKIQKAIANP